MLLSPKMGTPSGGPHFGALLHKRLKPFVQLGSSLWLESTQVSVVTRLRLDLKKREPFCKERGGDYRGETKLSRKISARNLASWFRFCFLLTLKKKLIYKIK